MNSQQTPLSNLNMHRERRQMPSLEELNRTLTALEQHLHARSQPTTQVHAEQYPATPAPSETLAFLRHEQPAPKTMPDMQHNPHKDALAAIANELQRLRDRTELPANSANITPAPAAARAYEHASDSRRLTAGTSRITNPDQPAPNTQSIMRHDFDDLKRTVETLAREDTLRRMSHRWDMLDERFDNFEQSQSEKLAEELVEKLGFINTIDPALDNINARLENLRHSIEQLPENQGQSLRQLDERLDEISRAILATSYLQKSQETEPAIFEELDRRFTDLTHHLDEQYTNNLQQIALNDQRAFQGLENRLDHIARQVSDHTTALKTPATSQADQVLLRNLEKQLGFITEQLSKPDELRPEIAEIKPRLDVLERAIDKNRDIVLGAAREAAEEAVRQVVGKGSETDTGFARQLAEDLKALEKLTRDSDERNSRTFDKVHDTLLKIADRLALIEQGSQPRPLPLAQQVAKQQRTASNNLSSQFSVPEWGKPETLATKNPFSDPNSAAMQTDATCERTETLLAARYDDESADASTQPTESHSFLSGLARAVGFKRHEATKDTGLPLATEAKPAPLPGADILTDQTATPQLTGMPDLNAIIRRVRDEQRGRADNLAYADSKSELISAARQTAQAAIAESDRLRDQDGSQQVDADLVGDKDTDGAENNSKRSMRKPLLMAIGAIVIAATGIQLGNNYLIEKSEATTTRATDLNKAPAPVNSAQTELTTASVTKPAPTQPLLAQLGSSSALPDKQLTQSVLPDQPPAKPFARTPQKLPAQPLVEPIQNIQEVFTAPAEADRLVKTPAITVAAIPAVPVQAGPLALRKAAEAGDVLALYEIGLRYTDGRGVTSDFAEAAKWYALSAERGFAPAQYRLGNLNEKGLGMPRDLTTAAQLYEQAAEQGNASAMHNLAVLYAMGADGTADNVKAAKWFFKAAELGVKDSQYNLGILAAKGLGRPQSMEDSYKWFALAAKSGDSDAAEKRDQVAQSLKPEQLTHAQNLVKLWKSKALNDSANAVQIPDAWNDEAPVTTASVDMKKAVRNIQLILKKNGFDAGTPDGMMGTKTRQAIMAFQKANGMAPTGDVDQPLVEALLARNS